MAGRLVRVKGTAMPYDLSERAPGEPSPRCSRSFLCARSFSMQTGRRAMHDSFSPLESPA